MFYLSPKPTAKIINEHLVPYFDEHKELDRDLLQRYFYPSVKPTKNNLDWLLLPSKCKPLITKNYLRHHFFWDGKNVYSTDKFRMHILCNTNINSIPDNRYIDHNLELVEPEYDWDFDIWGKMLQDANKLFEQPDKEYKYSFLGSGKTARVKFVWDGNETTVNFKFLAEGIGFNTSAVFRVDDNTLYLKLHSLPKANNNRHVVIKGLSI